ncbi:unnamed protein product [Auanema sp. JU1783]|nr:unnamed protein product [Auanema sp. JU1783]
MNRAFTQNKSIFVRLSKQFHSFNVASRSLIPSVRSCANNGRLLPSSQLVSSTKELRHIRTRAPGTEQNNTRPENDRSENGEQHEDGKKSSESEGKQPPKLDPATVKKLRMYVLVVAGLSFVSSFLILATMFKDGSGVPDGLSSDHLTRPGIDFRTFVDRYLKTGEVRNILFCPAQQRAIAFLHDGAVIDGKPTTDNVVVVSYAQNAQQFWADIRKEEALIGISLSNGVKIDLYQGLTTIKVVELFLGLFILAFLGTQYGRLLRQRILKNKAGKGPSSSEKA